MVIQLIREKKSCDLKNKSVLVVIFLNSRVRVIEITPKTTTSLLVYVFTRGGLVLRSPLSVSEINNLHFWYGTYHSFSTFICKSFFSKIREDFYKKQEMKKLEILLPGLDCVSDQIRFRAQCWLYQFLRPWMIRNDLNKVHFFKTKSYAIDTQPSPIKLHGWFVHK